MEAPNVSISVCLAFGAVKTSSSISAGRHSTEILLGMFLFVAYVHKNAHRSCHQNNNANYDWVYVNYPPLKGVGLFLLQRLYSKSPQA